MSRAISGATVVAGVAGSPIAHSLSPLIHNAWIEAAGLDAVFVAFSPPADSFASFVRGLAGGAIRGLNVTVPFKETALEVASDATVRARRAGAANLLVFEPDGRIRADNTDGGGLLAALADQAADFEVTSGPVVLIGAGGAARGAAAALAAAGAPDIRILNRNRSRAAALAELVGGPARVADSRDAAFEGARLVINATTLGLGGGDGPPTAFERMAPGAVALDMVYRPLRTAFLAQASAAGLTPVDGLAMLIGQAAPSFKELFGVPPPPLDVRGLCLAALGEAS